VPGGGKSHRVDNKCNNVAFLNIDVIFETHLTSMNKFFLHSLVLIILCLLTLQNSAAQDHNDHDHHDHTDHEHAGDDGHGHTNEISIAAGVVGIPKENEIGAALHLHYVRGLGEKKIFGLGGGMEALLESHKHITFSMVFHVRLYKGLILGYAPGMLVLVEDEGNEIQFAQHIELAYEFEVGRFHIGPLFELGIEKEGLHYTGGLHLGIDF
jgi:hypothetical protein